MTSRIVGAVQRGTLTATLALAAACGEAKPGPAGEDPAARIATSADGVRIAYDVNGIGSVALVFVHGWSCDRTYWERQVPFFTRTYQVVTVDVAGHGESGLGRTSWTIEAFGGDVAAVVNALEIERAILIGHSMGGDVVVEAARRLPGRVLGLVWVDTYRSLGPARPPARVQEMLEPFRVDFVGTTRGFVRGMFAPGADTALVERVVLDMSAAPPDVALAALESAWNFRGEIPAALAELNLPVIAINPADLPGDAASLERHGVELMSQSGVGHFLMMEDPDRFNDLLMEVVERLIRGG